jgi:phosphoenolpyruvate synthase/pyruvate phosphate dikinase
MSLALAAPLQSLSGSDQAGFGGKSASLGELLAAGIPVPPGFALSTEAFARFMSASGLDTVVDDAVGAAAVEDPEAVTAASQEIRRAFRAAPVPGPVREEIVSGYRTLGQDDPPVAVRSSAVGEDSAQATFAGQQETFLWVRGVDEACDAVRDCWASLYSAPAVSYRARLGGEGRPAMGVTVQLMVDAEVSGVMFTCNPVSGDPSMVAVNASWGLGLAVVGGEVTPDDFLVSKVTREVVRQQLSNKSVQYVPSGDGHGAERVEVAPERRDVACLDSAALSELVEVARRVEDHFGSHQDIEWAIDHDGNLFVVQSRPVTTIGKDKPKQPPPSALSMVMNKFGAGGRHGP